MIDTIINYIHHNLLKMVGIFQKFSKKNKIMHQGCTLATEWERVFIAGKIVKMLLLTSPDLIFNFYMTKKGSLYFCSSFLKYTLAVKESDGNFA